MKKIIVYIIMALCAITYSCKKASMTEVRPLSSSYSDTTSVLMLEDEYPCMKLVTNNVVHIQAIASEEAKSAGIIREEEPLIKHRYLPLETTEECLIGHIDKILSDDPSVFIFDDDNNSALRFSQKDGSFICRYGKRGRGPGEYTDITDMAIDKIKKEVCLLDFTQYKLLFFSYDGEFLREEPQYYGFGDIEYFENNLLLWTRYSNNTMAPAINNNSFVLAKPDQTPQFRGFPFPEQLQELSGCISHPWITCKDDIYFTYELSDTIWQIKEGGVCEARYVFKFPGRDNLFDVHQVTNEEYSEKKDASPYFSGLVTMVENFILTEIHGSESPGQLLYCIPTGHHYYTWTQYRYFATYKTFRGFFSLNGTSFVDIMQPFELLKNHASIKEEWSDFQYENYWNNQLTEEERQLLQKMTPEDNPILLIIDIEPF